MSSDMADLIREDREGGVVQLPDYYSETMKPKRSLMAMLGLLGLAQGAIASMQPPREHRPVVNRCGMTGKAYRKRQARAKMASASRKRNR